MFCRHCGNEINANAVACLNCGCDPYKGKAYCPNCGAQVNEQQIVCLKCGAGLKIEDESEANKSTGKKRAYKKDRVVAGLLAILLGMVGGHQFYLGNVGSAIARILIFCLASYFLYSGFMPAPDTAPTKAEERDYSYSSSYSSSYRSYSSGSYQSDKPKFNYWKYFPDFGKFILGVMEIICLIEAVIYFFRVNDEEFDEAYVQHKRGWL